MTTAHTLENFELALPHPYFTKYQVKSVSNSSSAKFSIQLQTPSHQNENHTTLTQPLHNSELTFRNFLKGDEEIPPSNNTTWARARRSLSTVIEWASAQPPSIGQAWLIIYVLFSVSPDQEQFRLSLNGSSTEALRQDLKSVGLAVEHPDNPAANIELQSHTELLVLRNTFWQGAGSPFGTRPVWLGDQNLLQTTKQPLSNCPPRPLDYTFTNKLPASRVFARHPVRPTKPTPGSTIYSRYIPHLKEHFSMVALDYENSEHLNLFHTWQNDPRVAAGWNETGTLDQHREYLRNLHNDPHTLTILAAFEGVLFAYFEVYWAKEDTLGAYYDAGDYDRGRHSLVGDTRFRGPHRVSAWWSSLIHYLFLDEPRTTCVVGEPKATNSRVLSYDFSTGFNIETFVDFPHKRSAFVRLEREKFFQIVPLAWEVKGLESAAERLKGTRGSKL